jgi:DNA-binding NarL/FixJ family response regulator
VEKMRVLLADSHTLVRRGIKAILESCDDIEVVGEAVDGWEAVEKVKALRPDVVLMDVFLSGIDGIEATRRIVGQVPEASVIMLTTSDSEKDLLEALQSGAQGYVLKSVEPEQLISMLRGIRRGEAPLSPSLTKKLISFYVQRRRADGSAPLVENLTAREREVLAQVAKGATNREVAEALFISENTVKNHLRNIMEKLQAKNRAQAVASALELGLIEPAERVPGAKR